MPPKLPEPLVLNTPLDAVGDAPHVELRLLKTPKRALNKREYTERAKSERSARNKPTSDTNDRQKNIIVLTRARSTTSDHQKGERKGTDLGVFIPGRRHEAIGEAGESEEPRGRCRIRNHLDEIDEDDQNGGDDGVMVIVMVIRNHLDEDEDQNGGDDGVMVIVMVVVTIMMMMMMMMMMTMMMKQRRHQRTTIVKSKNNG